jgi:hypothetical protein
MPPRLLREVPGQRRVWKDVVGGRECVTRVILHTRLDPSLSSLVEKIVLHGHGSMLGIIPEDLQLTLEGYRVAARLPRNVGPPLPWTVAVAAGVDDAGAVTISTEWIEGTPLHHLPPPPAADARSRSLDALRILLALHGRLVTYGDFKSENLVLRPDGTVALIDLDTLREVAEPTGWAPTRDLTRSWAAPEQVRQQRTYLASDLWAWARLTEHLFPDGAPIEWRPALAACRNADPLRRPRTDTLLAHLELGLPLLDWQGRPAEVVDLEAVDRAPSTGTERVPEPPNAPSRPAQPAGATERVPEGTPTRITPVEVSEDRPLPAPRRRLGCGWYALAALLSPCVLCGGLTALWDHRAVAEANAQAAEVMTALEVHKTQADLNTRSRREELRSMAEAAWETRHTPRTGAVRALATVWAQGWQDARRAWSAEDAAAAMAAIDDAAPGEPETLLARATLAGAHCRLNRTDVSATAECLRSIDHIDAFLRALPPGDAHNWLRVEAAWTEVLVWNALAAQATAAKLPQAADHRRLGIDRCVQAEPWLPWAPVNGPELLEDCLLLAGGAGDVTRYLSWSGLLLDADLEDGTLSSGTVRQLYVSAGAGCENATADKKRGEWVVRGPSWCVALGHAARRCPDLARTAAIGGREEDPARDWASLDLALTFPPSSACAR